MRTRTCGQLDGMAAIGAMWAKSRMRSTPGSAMLGNFFRSFRALSIGSANAVRRFPLNSCLTRIAISFRRTARSSGTMPPGFNAVASFAGVAAKSFSGAVPTDLVRDAQPFAQAASDAG